MKPIQKVLVTGGAGYVGAVLVPKLLEKGYRVRVLDLYIFGEHVLDRVKENRNLEQIKGDIRNQPLLNGVLQGCDAVIHLACISNDPSFELNPALGRSINYGAFGPLVQISKESGVRRFIYASSSSVYGVKWEPNVTEELSLEPLTDYSKYKALCEAILLNARGPGFVTLILRPATVCGYSPRLRLDLAVNILTNHAVNNRKILVFGGEQMRPNIHIEDVTDLYVKSLEWPDEAINGKVFNAGYENLRVIEIGGLIQKIVGDDVEVAIAPTDDNRSYHISSERIKRELGFEPKKTVKDAVRDLCRAFAEGRIPNPMIDKRYYNIKTMQALNLA